MMKKLFDRIQDLVESDYTPSVTIEDVYEEAFYVEEFYEDEEPNGDVFELMLEEDEEIEEEGCDCDSCKAGKECDCEEGIDPDLDDDEWLAEGVDGYDPQTYLLAFAALIEEESLEEAKVLTPDNIRDQGGLPSWFIIPPKWVSEITDDFPDSLHMWWAAVGETLKAGNAFDLRDPKSLKPIYGRVVKKWKKAIEKKYGHTPQASKGTTIKKDVEDAIREMSKNLKAMSAGKQISSASMKKAIKMANGLAQDQVKMFRKLAKSKRMDLSMVKPPERLTAKGSPDTSASGEGKAPSKMDIRRATEEFISEVSTKYDKELSIEVGRKYWRIINSTGSQRFAWAFIDKSNGDIYKAASYKRPAKHVRGNVLSGKRGMEAVEGTGSIAYMQPGRRKRG